MTPDPRVPRWTIRRAVGADADDVADVWLRSRRAAAGIPPPVHPEVDVRAWIADVVVAELECWVSAAGSGIVGMLALDGSVVDQLYVAPDWERSGVGSALLRRAVERRPGRALELWTFAANTGARRFYEQHGFLAVEFTDGRGNEEGAPDVRYRRPAD